MYTECTGPSGAAKAKGLGEKRSGSKIIRHALDTTHLSRQTEHPRIPLGSCTVTRAHLPWQHFLGYRVGTWVVKRGENKEICWRTYCGRLGPPNLVSLPHICLTSVTSEPWQGPSTQGHGAGWNLSSRVAVQLGCRRQLARVLFPDTTLLCTVSFELQNTFIIISIFYIYLYLCI